MKHGEFNDEARPIIDRLINGDKEKAAPIF